MDRVTQTKKELKGHLDQQLRFLELSARSYDSGFFDEAKRMATTIRILLHNTSHSKSLLNQLELEKVKFFNTSFQVSNPEPDGKQVGSYAGLIGLGEKGYIPYLDEPPSSARYVEFNDYWNEIILTDNYGNNHSRRDIILSIVNQDGGAHVDPELNEKYALLTRKDSMGWTSGDENDQKPIKGIELAVVRQIAHEVLRTLISNYPKKKMQLGGSRFVFGGPIIFSKNPDIAKKTQRRIGRNEPCPCGSGKKYKKCCGKSQ